MTTIPTVLTNNDDCFSDLSGFNPNPTTTKLFKLLQTKLDILLQTLDKHKQTNIIKSWLNQRLKAFKISPQSKQQIVERNTKIQVV